MGKQFAKSFFLTSVVLCVVAAAAVAYLQFSPYLFALFNRQQAEFVELVKPSILDGSMSQGGHTGLIRRVQNTATASMDASHIGLAMERRKEVPEWLYEYRVIANCPWRQRPHFVADNFDEYLRFVETRLDLNHDTIMWMVNSNSHLPHYSNIYTDHSETPLLINRNHRLPPGFRPAEMVDVRTANGVLLIPEAEEAFEQMRLAALEDGYVLRAVSGFRSAARQADLLYGRPVPNYAVATPYHSEHQTGRAIDVQNRQGEWLRNCAEARWVAVNAHIFGFIVRYTDLNRHITGFIAEPWHLTYVGIDIATHMHENNILSLEEFVGRNPGAQFGWRGDS